MAEAVPLNGIETKAPRPGMSLADYGLYAAVVLAWSFSWWPLKIQAESGVPVTASLVWRFIGAGALMLIWTLISRKSMRFGLGEHVRFAALGVFLFSTNFLLFYLAADRLPSGLLSVVFSLASIFNSVLMFAVYRERPSAVLLLAGIMGFVGLAFLFWPQIAGQDYSLAVLGALGLCIGGTLCFCTGNLISADTRKRGVALVPMTTWGMFYGACWAAFLTLVTGSGFEFQMNASYVGSLVFLIVVSSFIAFAAYLTLLNRIGPARAGYATVLFPVLALIVSSVVEDYRFTALGLMGLGLVLAGNWLVLRAK
ncbi:MAG: DMT family transporter [Pseudomonadota bacterium]